MDIISVSIVLEDEPSLHQRLYGCEIRGVASIHHKQFSGVMLSGRTASRSMTSIIWGDFLKCLMPKKTSLLHKIIGTSRATLSVAP